MLLFCEFSHLCYFGKRGENRRRERSGKEGGKGSGGEVADSVWGPDLPQGYGGEKKMQCNAVRCDAMRCDVMVDCVGTPYTHTVWWALVVVVDGGWWMVCNARR